MIIDETKFLEGYRKNFQRVIPQEQLDDILFLLNKLNESTKIGGTDWEIVKEKYAYVWATIFHETAGTNDPISEYGTRRYLMSKRYYPYYGRGYVMLTWLANYIKFGEFLGIDLVGKPWLANEPENAWLILEEGMTTNKDVQRRYDPDFTAYTLDDVFNEATFGNMTRHQRMLTARRIINGTDKARLIAGYAEEFYNIIELKEAA